MILIVRRPCAFPPFVVIASVVVHGECVGIVGIGIPAIGTMFDEIPNVEDAIGACIAGFLIRELRPINHDAAPKVRSCGLGWSIDRRAAGAVAFDNGMIPTHTPP